MAKEKKKETKKPGKYDITVNTGDLSFEELLKMGVEYSPKKKAKKKTEGKA